MDLLYAAHVPAGPGPFPTVIAIHGWGANAHDLLGLAPMLHGGRALVLCPQGQVTMPIGGGQQGYGWFPLAPGAPTAAASATSTEAVVGLKEIARQAARDAERVAIKEVLDRVHWNRAKAARLLQISYKALLYKIVQCGLVVHDTEKEKETVAS